ncbi:hypothetical protein [Siculibacillus lacustris]|nr:hypothetical protein [Siculibacillus lacustris]
MNRPTVSIVIAALCVVIAIIGWQLYQERTQRDGVDIRIGDGGVSIQKK